MLRIFASCALCSLLVGPVPVLAQRGVPVVISGPGTEAALCLRASDVQTCLEALPEDAAGLGEAWVSFGAIQLSRGDMQGAAESFDTASQAVPTVGGLALWARHYSALPRPGPARSIRNRARALRFLRRDSLDYGANLLVGAQDAAELARRTSRAALPAGITAENLTTRSTTSQSGGRAGVRFSDRYRGEMANLSVSSPERGGRLVRNTTRRLRIALRSETVGVFALRHLAVVHLASNNWEALSEDASTYRRVAPDHPLGSLIGALAAHMEGRSEAAATLGEIGIGLLAPEIRAAVLDPARVRPPDAPRVADIEMWWADADPIRLTPRNERLTEHLARWVYADMRFGNPYTGVPGAETDPGRVVLRYGIPEASIQYTGGDDSGCQDCTRYSVFRYQGFDFRFMDSGRVGQWSFFAPSATAYQGARANTEVRSADYVLIARQRFRDMPSLIDATWETGEVHVAAFRGTGGLDVLLTGNVPTGLQAAVTGASLLEPGGRPLSPSLLPVEPFVDGRVFVEQVRSAVPVGSAISARVEAVKPSSLAGPERTVVLSGESESIPAMSGFAVSGVLLADLVVDAENGVDEPSVWKRRGLRITPSGSHEFSKTAPIYAFFEVYGLSKNGLGSTDYEVTARLSSQEGESFFTRILRRGDNSVGAGFRSSGSEADIGEYLLIDTGSSAEGEYLLTLEIQDRNAGKSVETTTLLRLR